MEDILRAAIELMRSLGAEYCDARSQETASLGIRVSDREVRGLNDRRMAGICLRARTHGSWGYASLVSIDRYAVLEAASQAVRSASSGTSEGGPIPEQRAVTVREKAKMRRHPLDVPLEEKLEAVRRLDEAQRISDKVANTNSIYSEQSRKNLLVNSFGSVIEWEEVRTRLMAMTVAAENGRNELYYDSIEGTKGYELIEKHDLESFGAKTAQEAVSTLSAVRPPSGRVTCVSDPSISGLLAHEVMGHASEGDEIVKKRSFLTDVVGKKVASDQITMIDDGTIDGAYGSIPFDDEGTRSSRTTIIEKGIYKGYMHDLETAAAMGVQSTGNGRAQDFGRRMWVRMTNTFFEAGSWDLDEMIEGIELGILTDKMMSGMEDPVGGGFEAKGLRGFMIRNGKIAEMIRSFTMTGNALEILGTTDAVSKDVVLDGGTCGKGTEDWVPVTSGGPYCRSSLIVGGD